jgi:hypothetical protein
VRASNVAVGVVTVSLIPERDALPSREEVRQLEARIDARFQNASARFTMSDRRFAAVIERLEALEGHTRDLTKTTSARFDAVDARVEVVYEQGNLAAKVDRVRRRQCRTLAFVVVGLAVVDVVAMVAVVVLA